jgi:hypothetical protein
MKMAVFWDYHPDDWGSKYLWNVGKYLPDNTALQSRRQPTSNAIFISRVRSLVKIPKYFTRQESAALQFPKKKKNYLNESKICSY